MSGKKRVDASALIQDLDTPSRPVVQAPRFVKTRGNANRGFRLMNLVAHMRGIEGVDASPELEAVAKFRKAMQDCNALPDGANRNAIYIPLGTELLSDEVNNHEGTRFIKAMLDADNAQYDPDEVQYIRRIGKSQSWLIDAQGGALVQPPVMGEFVELMRPNQAVLNAGATMVPLPAQGRVTYPKQTTPTTAYFEGEEQTIPESSFETGTINLEAKKLATYLTMPNELLRFASISADALVRTDFAKSLALAQDRASLYGIGGPTVPKGLINYNGTDEVIDYAATTPAPKGIQPNGNLFKPEDAYNMVGLIEDRNFEFTGWIARPLFANSAGGIRADAVSPGDAAGAFVQSMMRAMSEAMPGVTLGGYPVVKSAIIRDNQVKGTSGATLTELWGGAWNHMLIGTYGALELATSDQTSTNFQRYRTSIRGVMFCDSVPRYNGAFIYYKQLVKRPS